MGHIIPPPTQARGKFISGFTACVCVCIVSPSSGRIGKGNPLSPVQASKRLVFWQHSRIASTFNFRRTKLGHRLFVFSRPHALDSANQTPVLVVLITLLMVSVGYDHYTTETRRVTIFGYFKYYPCVFGHLLTGVVSGWKPTPPPSWRARFVFVLVGENLTIFFCGAGGLLNCVNAHQQFQTKFKTARCSSLDTSHFMQFVRNFFTFYCALPALPILPLFFFALANSLVPKPRKTSELNRTNSAFLASSFLSRHAVRQASAVVVIIVGWLVTLGTLFDSFSPRASITCPPDNTGNTMGG